MSNFRSGRPLLIKLMTTVPFIKLNDIAKDFVLASSLFLFLTQRVDDYTAVFPRHLTGNTVQREQKWCTDVTQQLYSDGFVIFQSVKESLVIVSVSETDYFYVSTMHR